MLNFINYDVQVLSNSCLAAAERLMAPSAGLPADASFRPVPNGGYANESWNKPWCSFTNFSDSRLRDAVRYHLVEVSAEHRDAVFLLTQSDTHATFAAKQVIKAGAIVQEVRDENTSAARIWILPDIFASFRAEVVDDLPFGSLWKTWVIANLTSAQALRAQVREYECV